MAAAALHLSFALSPTPADGMVYQFTWPDINLTLVKNLKYWFLSVSESRL